MKPFNQQWLLGLLCLITACQSKPDTQSFIPGTYVNHAEGEYSVAYDTLIIQPLDSQAGSYRIYRKTAYRRIADGKLRDKGFLHEQWLGQYDAQTKSMQESKHGRTITFYPDAGRLLVGTREYLKTHEDEK